MGSIVHIASQLNTERTYLDPHAVFHKIKHGEPVPLGEPEDEKWAVPGAITLVETDGDRQGEAQSRHADSREPSRPWRAQAGEW